jgi:hypothetical protein
MKKTLYLFVGLMFTLKGYNQTYHPIPTDSVWWAEEYTDLSNSQCIGHYYKSIYPADTNVVIQGKTYTEFRTGGVAIFTPIGPPPNTCPTNYSMGNGTYAFIRNDVPNKKVYLYDTNFTHQEILLYDFDITLGDTIIPASGLAFSSSDGILCPTETFVVDSIDSVDIGGVYRKRFQIGYNSGWQSFSLIEGIGSNLGLANIIYCPFEYTTKFICYHYKDFLYAPNGNSYCSNSLAINEQSITTHNYVIKTGDCFFEIKNPEFANVNITCYDMLGKQVWNQHFTETGYLNLTETPAGVYIMYIEVNGQSMQPYKFVIGH